jgi:hypothetical protein
MRLLRSSRGELLLGLTYRNIPEDLNRRDLFSCPNCTQKSVLLMDHKNVRGCSVFGLPRYRSDPSLIEITWAIRWITFYKIGNF